MYTVANLCILTAYPSVLFLSLSFPNMNFAGVMKLPMQYYQYKLR